MDLERKAEALAIVRAELEKYPVAIGDVGFEVGPGVQELHELQDYLSKKLGLPRTVISIGRKAFDDTSSTTATYVIDSRPQ